MLLKMPNVLLPFRLLKLIFSCTKTCSTIEIISLTWTIRLKLAQSDQDCHYRESWCRKAYYRDCYSKKLNYHVIDLNKFVIMNNAIIVSKKQESFDVDIRRVLLHLKQSCGKTANYYHRASCFIHYYFYQLILWHFY